MNNPGVFVDRHSDRSSRFPGFYTLPAEERVKLVSRFCNLSPKDSDELSYLGGLSRDLADIFIENAVGGFCLPLGVATNFLIDGEDVLVPMAVEESSVLAAASHGAKLVRHGGGFRTGSTEPIMTGQIQIFSRRREDFDRIMHEQKDRLLAYANQGQNRLLQRGGGACGMNWRYIDEIDSYVIHLLVNVCDAMGANIVNTMCEKVASLIPSLFDDCEVGLRILTNLTDQRRAWAECRVPKGAFSGRGMDEGEVVSRIAQARDFAASDVYRAATHNKGVMNGIDAVVIATGNDWRAIEAGVHAYACRNGVYQPLTEWYVDDVGDLRGRIEVPMAVGTVGGVTKLHPTAQLALKMLGNPGAQRLAQIICAAGLAQNLSALRALASEGIQHGHMALHQKNLSLLESQERALQ